MTLESVLDSSADSPAEALRGLCGGRVHLPGDPAYDAVRVPWNVAVDQRPAAVAIPHDAPRSPRSSGPRPPPGCASRRRAPATTRRRWPSRVSATSSWSGSRS